MNEALIDYTEFNWIPLELAKNPGHWPVCADFLEEKGRYEDAECLRLADSLALPMVWCPPGRFMMGTPAGERGGRYDETPVDVTLTRGFWLGKYPVTQLEWWNVMGSNPRGFDGTKPGRMLANLDISYFPVDGTSWDNTAKFFEKLTDREHSEGRLPADWQYTFPTEAQWEYACRAGTTTAFYAGESDSGLLLDCAWFSENSELRPHAVGEKKPNSWGLHDMHGSTYEWCMDVWQDELPGGIDPIAMVSPAYAATSRVARGGTWCDERRFCRSAFRIGFNVRSDHLTLGCRAAVVRSA